MALSDTCGYEQRAALAAQPQRLQHLAIALMRRTNTHRHNINNSIGDTLVT